MLTVESLHRIHQRVVQESQSMPEEIAAGSPFHWPVLWSNKLIGFFKTAGEIDLPFSKISWFKIYLRDVLFAFIGALPKILISSDVRKLAASTLVFSWCDPNDFDLVLKNRDRYYGDLSDKTGSAAFAKLYILSGFFSEEQRNKLLANGISILYWEKSNKKIWHALKIILSLLLRYRNFKVFKHILNRDFIDNEILWSKLKPLIKPNFPKVKQVIFPYEAQPLQNYLSYQLSYTFHITSIGYVHSSLLNYPSYILNRVGSPETLVLPGQAYVSLLSQHCGWKENNLKVINSCRFRPRSKKDFVGKLFMPYFFSSVGKLEAAFKELVTRGFVKTKLEVRIHPDKKQELQHQLLAKKLESLMLGFPENQGLEGEDTFFIGATTAMLEALELGLVCVQLVENEKEQAFSPEVWPCLDVKEVVKDCFIYSLKEKGSFIRYSAEECHLLTQLEALEVLQ